MFYNPQLAAMAVRLAQTALNEIDMLEWATVACTYTEADNMQLTIMTPRFKRPVVLGFATFEGVPPYKLELLIRPKIAGALITAVKEMDDVS